MNDQKIESLFTNLEIKRNELLEVLEHWYYLQSVVLPKLQYLYDSYFGDLEYELKHKSKIAYELERKAELVASKAKTGEQINENTLIFIDRVVSKEIEIQEKIQTQPNYFFSFIEKDKRNAKFRMKKINHKTKQVNNIKQIDFNGNNGKDQEEIDFSNIYRRLVKKLHPDKVGETNDFKKYWNAIQSAYKSKAYDVLYYFYKALCFDDELKIDINEKNKKKNEINKIKNYLYELENSIQRSKDKVAQLQNEEPFIYEKNLSDKMWVIQRQRQLRQKLYLLDNTIFQNQRKIHSIIGYNIPFLDFIPTYRHYNCKVEA